MKSSTILLVGVLSATMMATVCVRPGIADPVKQSKPKHFAPAAVKTAWPQTCPVSGEKIASVKDAVGSSMYKGKTYYFCCSMCKPLFDKDPAKYAAAAAKGKYISPM